MYTGYRTFRHVWEDLKLSGPQFPSNTPGEEKAMEKLRYILAREAKE